MSRRDSAGDHADGRPGLDARGGRPRRPKHVSSGEERYILYLIQLLYAYMCICIIYIYIYVYVYIYIYIYMYIYIYIYIQYVCI